MSRVDWTATEPFGARIQLDLSAAVDEVVIAELSELFDTRRLLHFPAQDLSYARQREVSGWFGSVIEKDEPSYLSPDPDVGGLGDAELPFHSDLSCTPQPLTGISLHAIELDRDTSTWFVDAVAAAASLPRELRERLAGLHVMNLWPMDLSVRQRSHAAPPGWPGTVHSVLREHPRTGELLLSPNASHSDRIVEFDTEASEDMIGEVFARLYAPSNKLEHKWRKGDLLVWDNIALQHARGSIEPQSVRTLQRVEMGSASYMELMPPELMAAYNSA